MAERLVALDGSTFFVSDERGDVEPVEAMGFFHDDVRHLSTWRLHLNGAPIRLLSAQNRDYYSASVFGTLAEAWVGVNPPVVVRRDRFVGAGVHEDVTLENHSNEAQRVTVEFAFATDFADIFEVKDRRPKQGRSWVERSERQVTLWYERDGFRRGTRLTFAQVGQLAEDRARFDVRLAPRGRVCLCVDIACIAEGRLIAPEHRCGAFGRPRPRMPLSLEE